MSNNEFRKLHPKIVEAQRESANAKTPEAKARADAKLCKIISTKP